MHKLAGCSARAVFQLERATRYLTLVMTALPDDDDDPNRQFLYQTMVLMVQSFFEEYLRCVVSLATFWKTPEVRAHLSECYPGQAFDVMPAPEVGKWAQKRVSFDESAARIKGIMRVLVGVDLFSDENTETKCLDFVNVRNIIAHRGGWPNDDNVPTIRSAGVIVTANVVGTSRFYSLKISRNFFGDCLAAIHQTIKCVEAAAMSDSGLRLPG